MFRQCWCREPGTRKLLRAACPELGKKGHGSWYARYDEPRAPGEKRRQPVIGPYDTKKEAENALAAAVTKAGAGIRTPDRKVLVPEYLDAYMAGKTGLRPSSLATDTEAMELYWKPGLRHIRLADLRDSDIAAVLAAMRQINRPQEGPPSEVLRRLLDARFSPDGKEAGSVRRRSTVPLSPARVRRMTAPLRAALNIAEDTGRIERSPLRGVTVPRGTKVRPIPWTPERAAAYWARYESRLREAGPLRPEAAQRLWAGPDLKPGPVMVWLAADGRKFLEAIAGDPQYALFHLATLSGMRRGELLALPWPEVRIADGVLAVRDAKTDTGVRDVHLDEGTVGVLKAWRKQQAAWRLRWGRDWPDAGLVFTREDGAALPAQWASRRFETLAFRAGLPPVRFHDLRHFAASLGIASGADMKVVAEQLGHARSDFTRDYYAVVAPAQAKAAAEAAAAIMQLGRRDTP